MTSHPPVPFLDLKEQYAPLRDEITEAIEGVVESQYFILGPEVQKLEDEVAAYLTTAEGEEGKYDAGSGAEALHAIGCASGTDAILLPLMALREASGSGGRARGGGGAAPGAPAGAADAPDAVDAADAADAADGADVSGASGSTGAHGWHGDVIVPAFTFFATAGAVWNAGFRPVFCDVDPETFNVTGESIEAAWTEDTRAVIPVHLFGQMAPMDEVMAVVRDRARDRGEAGGRAGGSNADAGGGSGRGSGGGTGVLVLEDAAQAIGANRHGRPAGTIGDCGAFSFFPTKNLGGFGDGGMIVTRDPDLAERLSKLRVHGGLQMYHHEMVGTNSRLDALQAAVLRIKLTHLDRWAAARRENARRYDELLGDVDGVRTPVTDDGNFHTYNQYTLRVDDRDGLREFLAERDIGSGLYYPVPLHLQECFRSLGYEEGDFPVAEELCRRVVSLPVFPELGRERLEIVADAVREYYGA